MENVNLTIRIPPDLLDQLRERAKIEDRTLASLIRVLLAQAVRPVDENAELRREQDRRWTANWAARFNSDGLPIIPADHGDPRHAEWEDTVEVHSAYGERPEKPEVTT